jgi:hypothetical protein
MRRMFESRGALLLLLLVLGLGGLVALYVLRERRRRAVWDTLGQWHGLALAEDELVLEGSLEGYALRVLTEERENHQTGFGVEIGFSVETRRRRRRRGNTLLRSSTYEVTLVRFDVTRFLSRRFSLGLEGFWDGKDEQVGDPELDATFELHGVTYKVEELLKDEQVREHLRLLVETTLDVSVRDGWLQAEFDGVPATAEELEGLVLQVLEIPRALEAAVQRFHQRRPRPS